MFTIHDLYDIAIKMEKNGKTLYLESAAEAAQRDLKAMLKWMADEEAAHGKWFLDQKQQTPYTIEEKRLKEMLPDVLQDMMGVHTLNLEDINFSSIEDVKELVRTFIEFEQETIMFYETLGIFIEDENAQKGIDTIVAEEKRHVDKLQDMLKAL